jgi:DNA-binding LacI/PurR family transcriptional regulator
MPLVFVNREPDDAADDSVVSDNVGGAEKGVAHLIGQGHKRIGIVVGPQHRSSARQRQMGYHKALLDAGLPLAKELMVEAADTSFDSGLRCIEELLALAAPPTAVFVTNNPLTLGVVTGLRRAGRRVPRDVAVLAFDNSDWAPLFGLAGIIQPTHELGRQAALLLLRRLDGQRSDPERVVLDTELVPAPPELGG